MPLATLYGGEQVHAHDPSVCAGGPCAVHAPSKHCMSTFRQHWRGDRQLMERICPHGIGHPDPDHMTWYTKTYGKDAARYEAVHGCCGTCCRGAYGPDLRSVP